MPLVVQCSGCGKRHKVADKLRGKTAKCPCGAKIPIPAEAAAAAAANPVAAAAPPAGPIAVQCPGCSAVQQADPALAGKMVRCGCGAAFQVPGGAPVVAEAVPQPTAATPAAPAIPDPFAAPPDPYANPQGDPLGDPLGNPLGGADPLGAPLGTPPVDPLGAPLGGPAPGMPGDPLGGLSGADMGQTAAPLPQAAAPLPQATAPLPQAPTNAYAPPQSQPKTKKSKRGNPGRCYNCGSSKYTTPVFTWWGGMVGQHLISHVVCDNCGTSFNSRTGRSNTTAIVIYHLVILAFVLPLVILAAIFGNG